MMNNLSSLFQMINLIKQDPRKFLSRRFNVPENVGNEPQDIVQYLLNSGQVSQSQVNNAMSMKNLFMK